MTAREYDCPTPRCGQYHVLVERKGAHPRCPDCGVRLRLVRVVRKMDEAARARIRAAAVRP